MKYIWLHFCILSEGVRLPVHSPQPGLPTIDMHSRCSSAASGTSKVLTSWNRQQGDLFECQCEGDACHNLSPFEFSYDMVISYGLTVSHPQTVHVAISDHYCVFFEISVCTKSE